MPHRTQHLAQTGAVRPETVDRADLAYPGRLVLGLWTVAAGSGPPLVLLHGNGESHRVFDRLLPLLAPRFTVIGIDSPGHGRSIGGHRPLRIAQMADDVAGVLRACDLAGSAILGFSDGGNIALELALRHPGLPGPLILVGANLTPDGLLPAGRRAIAAAHAAARLAAPVLPPTRALAERLALMVTDPAIDAADLAQITVPALVVSGERDAIRSDHTAMIAASLPRGRQVVIPGAGHMLPTQAAPALAAAAGEFLAGVAGYRVA